MRFLGVEVCRPGLLGEMMSDAPTSAGPPPGWYADSPHAARVRWWNGAAWTDHYQAATDATAILPPVEVPVAVEPVPVPLPTTRAARRAAATAAVATQGDPPPPGPASAAKAVPDPAATLNPAPTPQHAAASESDSVRARAQMPPSQTAWLTASAPEPFPDQILGGRAPRMAEYRPPPRPVVYQPHASNYAAAGASTFIPVTSSNGPAAASLVLSFLGLAGGAFVHLWVSPHRPTLGGLLNLLIIAAFLCAVGLAIVGLVLASQRPTRKGRSVLALIVSALLLGGMCALFALRMIPVGALYGGG